MSKAISFGFGKSKPAGPGKPGISSAAPKKTTKHGLSGDSDHEDEEEPRHESVTGFASSGAILSQPVQERVERVIENSGNADWRRRGHRNLLPTEVQAAQNGAVVMVERDEVSKASGLQFAEARKDAEQDAADSAHATTSPPAESERALTEDEIALQALLDDGSGRRKTNAIIKQFGNTRLTGPDETVDFRADVASRPDSSTLEDYAAMPVEEFGLAMLRGMGKKRKANGEVMNLSSEKPDEKPTKIRKQEGLLGIGAKAAPGSDVELGAWGKADMRKNNKGQGFFTPLMRENKKTGERITDEELQKRVQESKYLPEEDWRDRRDRNLEHSGRNKASPGRDDRNEHLTNGDDYRNQMNGFSRRDRDSRHHSSFRSRYDDDGHDKSRSRRERSRSRDRRRRHYDDERYESSSSHRSRHRDDRAGYRSSGERRHRDKG